MPKSEIPGISTVGPDKEDKRWMTSMFERHLPAGRLDVHRLRSWLQKNLAELEERRDTDPGPYDLLGFAESVLHLYTLGFHEITRQVILSPIMPR